MMMRQAKPSRADEGGSRSNRKSVRLHARTLVLAAIALVTAALSGGTADEAVEALWKFVSPQGLLYDFLGDVPTPKDCAENRPNAMGYWCPIENGPMFTGPFLQAMALRAKRTRDPEDARRCRVLAEGLLLLASVSDEPGFVARGVGTDGKCHFPIGGPDQTVPWFLGLDAYLHSGLCDAALKARIVAKLKEVGEALEAADWRPPMEAPFKGEKAGPLYKGSLPFRAATQYLFCLRALADATGEEKWKAAYRRTLGLRFPRPEAGGLTYLQICELGCGHDQEVKKSFKVAPNGLWIYVGCAQGCLATLAEREEDAAVAQKFRTGLARSADYARSSMALYKGYPNVAERPFKYANWRAGWNWWPQKTLAEVRAVSSNTNRNRKVLGQRKDVERKTMTAPLSAAAICAYAGKYREEVLAALSHYDYSTIALSEFYAAPLAFELLNTTTNKENR